MTLLKTSFQLFSVGPVNRPTPIEYLQKKTVFFKHAQFETMFWLHVGPWVFWEWESSRMTIFWNLKKTHSLILSVKNGITFAILSMDWFVYLHVSCIISLKLSKWGKYTLHGIVGIWILVNIYVYLHVYHILLYQPGIHKTHHFWRVLQKFQLPHKMKSFGMKKFWVTKKGIAWFTIPKTNILLMEEILHQVKTDHVRYNTAMSLQAILQWSTKLLYRTKHTPCAD